MLTTFLLILSLLTVVQSVNRDLNYDLTSFSLSLESIPDGEVVHVSDLRFHPISSKTKRSDTNENQVPRKDVEFHALGKKFRMILKDNHRDILTPDFKVVVVDAAGTKKQFHDFDQYQTFSGHLKGKKNSHVSAHINSETGIMTASITSENNNYVLEPIRGEDGVNQTSMYFYKTHEMDASVLPKNMDRPYCQSINLANETFLDEVGKERHKRSDDEFGSDRKRCNMRLVADYKFYRDHRRDINSVVSHLISVFDRINMIYMNTEFADVEAGESSLKGFGFVVQQIMVHEEPSNEVGHYNFAQDQWVIRDLLEAFSRDREHKWYCLSHLFTHQRFENGVLGLAFVAHTRRLIPGGICTQPVTKSSNTYYYNTGVTTTKNSFGHPIFTRITDLITAHELGHNWGAEHDPDLVECSPRSAYGGAYLMHTYSLAGYEGNNKIFSPCSKRSIANVLKYKAFSCFMSHQKAFCGNGVVEEGEDCDAGLIGGKDKDPCCSLECKLKQGASCSDINDLCCEKCRIKARGSLCREGNPLDCKESTHCDGFTAKCPSQPPAVQDGKDCIDQGTCNAGSCIPFCESKGLVSCMCDKRTDHCIRCCRERTANSSCQRFLELPDRKPLPLKDGTPCIYGYCDRGFCRKSNQDTITRLWGYVDDVGMNGFVRMLKDNLVFAVSFILAVIWIPASYYIKSQDDEMKAKMPKIRQSLKKKYTRNGNNRINGSESTPSGRNGDRMVLRSAKNREALEMQGLNVDGNTHHYQDEVFDEIDNH